MRHLAAIGRLAGLILSLGLACTGVAHRVFAEASAVPPRVVTPVSEQDRLRLVGNTHPLARPEFDRGLLAPATRLERMLLVLKRSPEQDGALAEFNHRQHDPHSPDYHHWLTAEEFGASYGPADADIAAVTGWLIGRGFQIYHVNEGKVSIEFSGTVAQVQDAFQVQMHHYLVDGREHIANDRDPQIPRSLAPVVGGVASLNDFRPQPLTTLGGYVRRDRLTGKITPVTSAKKPAATAMQPRQPTELRGGVQPDLGYEGNDGLPHEDLTPFDFATIYNVLPLWEASTPIIGTGVTVAIAGGSDIALSDIATFRASFGLPAKTPAIVHNGADPGETGDQVENTLDVEMAGSSAPGANITLVVSGNTSTTPGYELSIQYIVSNKTAPIMSASYGECELELGASGNAFFNNVFQQGATEGISIFISSGDQGSAGCDHHQTTPDEIGLAVNGLASPPYVTAVGGTDFIWSFVDEPLSTYWNSTATAQGATAKGYIPEVPWNSTCANPVLLNVFVESNGAPEFSNTEALCNAAFDNDEYYTLVTIGAGSGGVSDCTAPTGTTVATCTGGYAKPSWQTGTGVPADGKRDVPDVSLFSSLWQDSTHINGSAILFCHEASGTDGCNYNNPDYIIYQEIGGTSAASPYMAGVMALVLQKTAATQGLPNPTLYKLAATDSLSSCNTSTVKSGNSCVFYDVTSGTNSQVCYGGYPNCSVLNAGDLLGTLSGYPATTGFDRATGLGSLNITNLVEKWTSVAPSPTVTLSPSSLRFGAVALGSTSAAQNVTLRNTGSVAVTLARGAVKFAGADASSFEKTAATCGATLAVGASCTISVAFKPAASGRLSATLTVTDSAAGSPQEVALSGTGG